MKQDEDKKHAARAKDAEDAKQKQEQTIEEKQKENAELILQLEMKDHKVVDIVWWNIDAQKHSSILLRLQLSNVALCSEGNLWITLDQSELDSLWPLSVPRIL